MKSVIDNIKKLLGKPTIIESAAVVNCQSATINSVPETKLPIGLLEVHVDDESAILQCKGNRVQISKGGVFSDTQRIKLLDVCKTHIIIDNYGRTERISLKELDVIEYEASMSINEALSIINKA